MGVAYREYRTGRVTGREDLAANLRFQVFGSLPTLSGSMTRKRLGSRGPDLNLLFRECMDGVRTTLIHNEVTESCRVIMVTSPGSQEGKTTLAAHLSASIARGHRKTLLIDCDTRRACIHRLFDLPREPGLSQVLKGELDVAEAVKPGSVEGLFVLTAGPFEPDGMNAASKKALEKLFAKLRQEYDYIIVDSCPVLPVVDSLLVGVHVDGVILSVRPRVSQLPRLFEAYERLRGARIPVLGAVLNGVLPSIYSYESHYLVPAVHES
jgi:capsular exopolysaccharide synthesis family protein